MTRRVGAGEAWSWVGALAPPLCARSVNPRVEKLAPPLCARPVNPRVEKLASSRFLGDQNPIKGVH
jgi:hypothetical protein